MESRKLCLSLSGKFGIPFPQQIEMLREAGFDGFFAGYESARQIGELRRKADECGMIFQSVHAPFGEAAAFWRDDEEAIGLFKTTLLDCVHVCSEQEIPLMISHTYIGFDEHPPVTERGIVHFSDVVREAGKCGVRVAFENTEGEEFLDALLRAFRSDSHVGFCWDSGHELCYNRPKDMLALYGDRVFGTHLNDNLGVTDPEGKICCTDDLHLLPYDGIADWKNIASRLDACGFMGPLTFELKSITIPGVPEDGQDPVRTAGRFFAEAHARACRFLAESPMPQ